MSYHKTKDLPVGLWIYNVDVTPDGKLALTVNNGNDAPSDGNTNTISIIDIESNPARVIMAISLTGRITVAVLQRGANMPHQGFSNRNSSIAVLAIDVRRLQK